MRTKTLLLFVFLLTGMTFSQQGGTGKITFDQIISVLQLTSEQSIEAALGDLGYRRANKTEYRGGGGVFYILPEAGSNSYYFQERHLSKVRQKEIVDQALDAGLEERSSNNPNGFTKLSGEGFELTIIASHLKVSRSR
ncbi:MAG: hypothetical protein HBSAPP04_23080 [Ignavibacteriaceae bacterium]|nr:MAG: hypothetical protein HBSAPP04_23080 [Ignavibacteriaceae bacterium]